MNRVGIGVDVHQFAADRRLVMGGIEIPHDRGLAGHSDADVLAHAVADALLGAAALGDIGKFYPDTDSRWKDLDSLVILDDIAVRFAALGAQINNIDATVVAQEPKLAPHIPAMQQAMAARLKIAPEQLGIKATTSEWLGFTGRKEGILAIAVASIEFQAG